MSNGHFPDCVPRLGIFLSYKALDNQEKGRWRRVRIGSSVRVLYRGHPDSTHSTRGPPMTVFIVVYLFFRP
jgi:hypothetical protein